MGDVVAVVVVAAIVLSCALLILGMVIHGKYIFPGVLDAKYPLVANGDIYPIGSRRRGMYLLGVRLGQAELRRDRENRYLTAQRRATTQARKGI